MVRINTPWPLDWFHPGRPSAAKRTRGAGARPSPEPVRLAVSVGWCPVVLVGVSRDAANHLPPYPGGHRDSTDSIASFPGNLRRARDRAQCRRHRCVAPPTTIEDQDDRPIRNPRVEEARRSRSALERFRSGERSFVPDPDIIGDVADPPQARPVSGPPAPSRSPTRCRGGCQPAAWSGRERGGRVCSGRSSFSIWRNTRGW